MSVRPAVAERLCSHWVHVGDPLGADSCFCPSEIALAACFGFEATHSPDVGA